MSFSFENLWSAAETVMTDVLEAEESIAPIVAAIPGAAPIVQKVTDAASAVNAAVTAGKSLVEAMGPMASELQSILAQLFHVTVTPGALVLTPKTSAATVPVAPAPVAATQAANVAAAIASVTT